MIKSIFYRNLIKGINYLNNLFSKYGKFESII